MVTQLTRHTLQPSKEQERPSKGLGCLTGGATASFCPANKDQQAATVSPLLNSSPIEPTDKKSSTPICFGAFKNEHPQKRY